MSKKINLEELLKGMSLEEKVGQLLQLAPHFYTDSNNGEITGPMKEMGITQKKINQTGSVLGISGAREMKEIQERYLANNQHKIPLIFMADIIHGYRTIYPIPLGLGCTWDINLAEESARVAAREASVGGIHVTFSPMVDLVRDPRWGRVMESTGEDPFLNSLFARAFVRGYQGDFNDKFNIAACVKHFAAYGAPEGGRDYNTVNMSERNLREYYLPAYKAAIDEGVKMLMTSFNTVDGVPSTGNEWLMKNLLRDEWNFDGVVISDWGAVSELIPHGVAEDGKEAAEKAIKATVDIEMMTPHYINNLEKLVKDGVIDEKLIDDSVMRILKLKEELGLFENPYRTADEELEKKLILCDEHRESARKAAEKSFVLLKNEEILPFSKEIKKVAVIGPFADNNMILGGWSWQGKFEETVTLKDGLINLLGKDKVEFLNITTSEIDKEDTLDFTEAVRIAKDADVVILALGEYFDLSGEGGSRTNINLPGNQELLVDEILKLEKKTMAVIFSGRPLDITNLSRKVPAIIQAFYPGTEGGNALANVIFGEVMPEGRLTMSLPYNVGQVPVYYNCFNTGRPKANEESKERFCTHYLDAPNKPLYPFGHGLTYTKFEYSDLIIDKSEINVEERLNVSVKVKNIGTKDAVEVVQLYIRDMSASVVRPIKELKDFRKVELKVGEEKIVNFEVTEKMLRFHTLSNEFKSEKGKFVAMVGSSSQEVKELEFKLV